MLYQDCVVNSAVLSRNLKLNFYKPPKALNESPDVPKPTLHRNAKTLTPTEGKVFIKVLSALFLLEKRLRVVFCRFFLEVFC